MSLYKVLAMLKEVVLKRKPAILVMLNGGGGGAKRFYPLKGGRKVVPSVDAGGHIKFQTHDFPIL